MFCENCGKELADGAKFCSHCGNNLDPTVVTPTAPTITTEMRRSYRRKAWFWGLGPTLLFVLIIVFWGVVNLFAETGGSESDTLSFINDIVIPFIIGLNFLAFPLGIVLAIYYGSKTSD